MGNAQNHQIIGCIPKFFANNEVDQWFRNDSNKYRNQEIDDDNCIDKLNNLFFVFLGCGF